MAVRVEQGVCIPFIQFEPLQTKETLRYLFSSPHSGVMSLEQHGRHWLGMGSLVTTSLDNPLLSVSPALPLHSVYFYSPLLEQLFWMGGEVPSLWEHRGKGAFVCRRHRVFCLCQE